MIEDKGQSGTKLVTIYDDIYNLPDCRAYYRAMDLAGFRTAHYAATAFRAILTELKHLRGLSCASVVDFASGYGIAAALMRHELSLDDVLTRYRDTWFDNATNNAVISVDKDWYANSSTNKKDQYYGIDIADQALAYGKATGIFDEVYPEDLQESAPSSSLTKTMRQCDLIVECGSIGHMLPDALDRLLSATQRKPWVATAPIRGNDTQEALDVLQKHGLSIETLDMPPFRHRRFSNADEQTRAIANAKARGHSTDGFESTGYYHAQIFLARPSDETTPVNSWNQSPIASN